MKRTEHQSKSFILIYSHSPEMRLLLKSFLKIWNCDFDAVDNEKDLLNNVRATTPTIILFDVSLSLEDDLRILRRLRQLEESTKIPVMALSGHVRSEELMMTLAAGANKYFVKPIDFDRLGHLVNIFAANGRRKAENRYGDIR